jgi:asparagine synthase (glutamine-hydrolysing)
MCGINGIFAYHYAALPVDAAELRRTRDYMAARGPDGSGEWICSNRRAGFGHRRLAIIDLSDAGLQPMTSPDGAVVVTFNGEIYNYRELRTDLEGRGCIFRTQSDTEVLLHLYARYGADMVPKLRGMFAFAIWDARSNSLFLARDPYGVKPLYYSDDGWSFRFASQVKALRAGGRAGLDPDPAGQAGFYLFGFVPEPFTTYADIRALPAGASMRVDAAGARRAHQYFSLASALAGSDPVGAEEQGADAVHAALADSVRHHLVADVPVGSFLSAGIDSGALVGLMRDAGQNQIQSVTLAFDEFRGTTNDESVVAAEVAKHYGATHTVRSVSKTEFLDDFPKILAAMDQPSIDGFNTWFVSKAAKELGLKVAISGLGGDELFAGYPSFRQVPLLHGMLRMPALVPGLGSLWRLLLARLDSRAMRFNPKWRDAISIGGSIEGAYWLRRGLFARSELTSLLGADAAREGLSRLAPLALLQSLMTPRPRSPLAKIAALESGFYMRNQLLRDTDWASMAHSLEVRVPLVDSALLQRLGAGVGGRKGVSGKQLLATAPSRPLPQSVMGRKKTGFLTPFGGWIDEAAQATESQVSRSATWPGCASRRIAHLLASF